MNIYLICNNLLSNNMNYDNNLDIESKKRLRPLSVEGVQLASKIKISTIESIYSSYDLSNIETGKFLAESNGISISLTEDLNDCIIGNINSQSLKMLSYFQEHDFDYKLEEGESLKECGNRIEKYINSLKSKKENCAVILPRRALFSYLIKHTEHGYNLDERLVLMKEEDVLMEGSHDSLEMFKITFINNDVEISKIQIEEFLA